MAHEPRPDAPRVGRPPSTPFEDALNGRSPSRATASSEQALRGLAAEVEPSKFASRGAAVANRRCEALVRRRHAKATGEGRCTNRAKSSGFCTQHEYLAERKGRGLKTVAQKYLKVGESMHVSPVTAMTSLLQEAAGNVEYYRREVTNLERMVIAGRKEREEVAKMVVLYNEERDRLQRYTADALRINLDARQSRMNEMQMRMLATIAKAVIESLGLKGAQREQALHTAALTLREHGPALEEEWHGPLQDATVLEGTAVAS